VLQANGQVELELELENEEEEFGQNFPSSSSLFANS
jgi:hypothetical protein